MNLLNKLSKVYSSYVHMNIMVIHSHKCQVNRIFVRNVRSFMKKGVDEPKYLDYLKPQIPYYPLLNIQIRGYDFVILENYLKYLHKLSNKLGVNVVKVWAAPHSAFRYDVLKPESEVPESQTVLNIYERNLQIENLSAKMTPILLEILLASVPAGVTVNLHEHNHLAHEESRFIPDLQLAQYKEELQEMKGHTWEEEEPKAKK